MMRLTAAALVLLAVPTMALGQSASSSSPSPTSPRGAVALPPIGLPLPAIGLPLPPLGLPPAAEPRRHDSPTAPQSDQKIISRPGFRPHTSILYFASPYADGWGYAPLQATRPGVILEAPAAPTPPAPPRVTGRLRLELQPSSPLQFFVDGEYVGAPEDRGYELELEPGARRIEIRARGHEPLTFTARIVADETLTYRGTLTRIAAEPENARDRRETAGTPAKPIDPAAAAKPQTFYFIPGCYLGNIPPQDVTLPADCDLTKLVTRTTQ